MTHYPATLDEGVEITKQEAWIRRDDLKLAVPEFIMRAVEQIAFEARKDKRVDMRSGVSQRLPISVIENVVSNAERRRLAAGEAVVVPRISDIYAALPSITGKLELEYEGEQHGAQRVARDVVRAAVGKTFDTYFEHVDCSEIIEWFNEGGSIKVGDGDPSDLCMRSFAAVPGLIRAVGQSGLSDNSIPEFDASVCELVLEGLYAHKKISRSDERGYVAARTEKRSVDYDSFNRSRRIN
jgi:magnesium chelatase subunit I